MRILRSGDERLWLVVGLVAGIGLLNKDLVAFLAFGVLAGLAIAGPRRHLASPWLWAGALIAGLLWTPYLVWQAQHGWPQLAVARSIAAGRSGTSEPRWAFLPYQLLLIGPFLAPVWIAGLVRLFRDPALRFAARLPGAGSCWPRSSSSRAASPTTWAACCRCSSAPARRRRSPGCRAGGRACAAAP